MNWCHALGFMDRSPPTHTLVHETPGGMAG
jgi:hypothetical protein